MRTCSFSRSVSEVDAHMAVRKDEGFEIDRRAAYNYKHLAFTFRKKIADPFLVTVEPNDIEKPTQHAHEGQEFNYVVEGSMTFFIGDIVYELNEGDSVYFNSDYPHAMKANNSSIAIELLLLAKARNGEEQVHVFPKKRMPFHRTLYIFFVFVFKKLR